MPRLRALTCKGRFALSGVLLPCPCHRHLPGLCAVCGFSYGEHMMKAKAREQVAVSRPSTARPSTARPTTARPQSASTCRPRTASDNRNRADTPFADDSKHVQDLAVSSSPRGRGQTARRAMSSARPDGRYASHREDDSEGTAPAREPYVGARTAARPRTAGTHRSFSATRGGDAGLASSEPGPGTGRTWGAVGNGETTAFVRPRSAAPSRAAGDDYAHLYDVAPGDLLDVEEEVVKPPSGAVCDEFVPGCLGPAPFFRAQARVREAAPMRWQFMNAYNGAHGNAFPVFARQRGLADNLGYEPRPEVEAAEER